MDNSSTVEKIPDSGTWFAPAAHATANELRDAAEYCLHNPVTRAILASVEGYVLILNEQRQVLAANPAVLADLNVCSSEELLGLRPGEAFSCVYRETGPAGCGTSKNCSTCGAVISILSSNILNQPATGECLMSVEKDGVFEAHEFIVRATPLKLGISAITIFVIHDISSTKRRDVLENIFIHDLNNILTGLRGWSEILVKRPQDVTNIAQKIVSLSTHLTEEVDNQRMLLQAERGELKVSFARTSVSRILSGLRSYFSGYPPDKVHRLIIHDEDNPATVQTSLPLLTRILANMVKNALEATMAPEQVNIYFQEQEDIIRFIVKNPGEIPETVAMQIFKRSFSTKGASGRGLGTYSMKLFGEQYLGGKVGFLTDPELGTSFYIEFLRG